MAKNIKPATAYAKPHSMSGGPMKMQKPADPNTLSSKQMTNRTVSPRLSMGDPAREDVKSDGIKVRGTGAATKGLMARGPMG